MHGHWAPGAVKLEYLDFHFPVKLGVFQLPVENRVFQLARRDELGKTYLGRKTDDR